MKLCNHRGPRNGPGSCNLRVCQVSKSEWDWHSAHVFVKEGELPDVRKWYTQSFECTERMSAVCPYRVHTPIVKEPPKPKPEKCKRCGSRHYSGVSQAFCDAKDEFEKQMQPWNLEGSKQSIWSDITLDKRYRPMLWPWVVRQILDRDDFQCQDCGAGQHYKTGKRWLECHHIIPKSLGGSDHPSNLKLVCQNCHKKYNEKFNGEIISKKAQERKTRRIKEIVPKSLEEFA